MRKLQRGIAATVLLIAATTAQAQSIVGRVVDAKTKEPLIGAVVSLQGTDTKTVTDTDGQFHFDHLSTTTPYTLLVKYVGYKNTTIDGVHAKAAGKSSDGGAQAKASAAEDVLTVALKSDEQQLKGVTVTGVKRRNTVTAAVLEVKNSPVIVSNISAQDIKLTQDANAGEVIRRVPGVSLIDDKFVMTTGIYGNKYLIPMLFENGLGEDAMRIMFGRTFYDFGTMMDDGATSLWECLEMKLVGMKGLVPSFNHPMHSGFAYMYYAQLAGIKPTKPGFAEFEVRPCVKGAPDKVSAKLLTVNGLIVSDRNGDTLRVTVPANTRCRIVFGSTDITVGSGEYEVR